MAVLVLLDRNIDLVPMVSHSWTYQALVNDVLGMRLNRVSVEVRRSPELPPVDDGLTQSWPLDRHRMEGR